MPGGWKRRGRPTYRATRSVGSAGVAGPHDPPCEQELLDTVWEGLNIARDNKALVMVMQATIININQIAAELFDRSLGEPRGKNIAEFMADAQIQRSTRKRWETTLKRAVGRPIPVEVTRQPLTARLSSVEVYAIRDLRERRQTAEQLQRQSKMLLQHEEDVKTQNAILDAALSNMLQGLAMFDAEQRLIVCNRRYAEMYALTPEQVKPGTTVREILEHRMAGGFYHVRDTEGFVNSWTSKFGEVSSRIQELADGRIICVSRHQMANGGRLVTHEDITERQKLSSKLAEQNALLKEREQELRTQEERLRAQNLQLDAALNNMVQGLAMFDAEYRLVLCNRRYAEIYGLKPEQVAHGTALRQIIQHRIDNGLHADRSPDELVDAMLLRLADANFEQFYSQLSDGRCIAITVQPMADGGTVTTHQDITDQRRSEARLLDQVREGEE